MPAGYDFLLDLRVDEIMEDFQDVRQMPGDLVFLGRLNKVPADNRQLLARYQGHVQIADLIATNAKAPVYKAAKWRMESNTLGKMKIGTHWSEDEMEDLLDLVSSPMRDPRGILARGMIRQAVMDQLMGIEWRMEWLAVAMALNGAYGTSEYNRLGFNLGAAASGVPVSWGMPAELNVTLATPWTDKVNARPIDNILSQVRIRKERFGRNTNRMTLPTDAVRALTATDDFAAKVRMMLAPNESYVNISQFNDQFQRDLLGRLLNQQIVTYDTRYWSEADDGSRASYRFMPLAPQCPVVLDDSANDRNNTVADFGIGTPMESRMDALLPNDGTVPGIAALPAGQQRVVSYAHVDPRLDPPGLTMFSVAKGFPRKYDPFANSVLWIGNIAETIPTGDIILS